MGRFWIGFTGFLCILSTIVYAFWPLHWIYQDPNLQAEARGELGVVFCIIFIAGLCLLFRAVNAEFDAKILESRKGDETAHTAKSSFETEKSKSSPARS